MIQASEAFWIRYGSYRALDADHEAYIMHGGFVLPAARPVNQMVQLRFVGPDGVEFTVAGRTGQAMAGRGTLVSFPPDSGPALAALENYVRSDRFKRELERETEGSPATLVEPADVITWPQPAVPESEAPLDPPTQPEAVSSGVPASVPSTPAGPAAPGTGAAGTDELGHLDRFLQASSGSTRRRTHTGATEIRPPEADQRYVLYVVVFSTVSHFVEDKKSWEEGCLRIPIEDPEVDRNDPVRVRLQLPGRNQFEMWAVVEANEPHRKTIELRVDPKDESHRKSLLFVESRRARGRMARESQELAPEPKVKVLRIEEKMPSEDEAKMPIRRRIQRMGMEEKINMALSGGREERMALAMDSNKGIHHYLLKNAKITLDEIAYMARLPSLNPDVLDKIAENPQYTQNPQITKALVFNPRTPVRTSIRLLDRMNRSDLMMLSKRNNMNKRLVMAAKKKVTGSSI